MDQWLAFKRYIICIAYPFVYLINIIIQVKSDEEAIKLMNDSPYGLTASVWTNAAANPESEEAFLKLVDELETGTVFLNR